MSIVVSILLPVLLVLDVGGVSVLGVPASMGMLALIVVLLAVKADSLRAPSWLQVAFLAAFCLGLVPAARGHLAAGIREAAQCFAVIGVAWVLFASAAPAQRRIAQTAFIGIGVLLMLWSVAGRCVGLPMPFSDARLSLILCLSFPFLVGVLVRLNWKQYTVPVAFVLFLIAGRNGGLILCGLAGGLACIVLSEKKRAPRLLLICIVSILLAQVVADSSAWQTLAPRRRETGNLKRLFVELEATPAAVAAAPVTGHGLGRYRYVIHDYFARFADPDDNRVVPDTNSTYTIMATEAGLVAALLFVILVFGTALRVVWRARHDTAAAPAACAAAALAFSGLFTVILTRNTGMAAALVLGAATAALHRPAEASRWAYKPLAVLAAAILCLGANTLYRGVPKQTSSGLIILNPETDSDVEYWLTEAENPLAPPGGAMTIAPANDASGNSALAIPADAGKGKGSACYRFADIPVGTCSVWVRASWTDACSNSIGCVIAGKHMVISDEIFGKWHWVASVRRVDLPGGSIDLRLQNLEDGVMIDQILLVSDARLVPHGIMPEPSRGH